jgi:DNA adenine methylase
MPVIEQELVQAKPFIKWVGGKAALYPTLEKYFPNEYNRYFEPFLGGGAVFFNLQPKDAILSDSNAELVVTYRVVRERVYDLIQELELLAQRHSTDFFYEMRSKRTQDMGYVEMAARLIYLNKAGFNGLYRVNSKGEFNVPIGRTSSGSSPAICQPEVLMAASKALQGTQIQESSANHMLNSTACEGDWVYLDPPYATNTGKSAKFTAYQKRGFDLKAHLELRDTCRSLNNRGVLCTLSNSDIPEVREMYQGFYIKEVYAPRSVGAAAKTRQKVQELIITNYPWRVK